MVSFPISHWSLQQLQQIYHELWMWRMFKDAVYREVSNYINTDMSDWYLRSDPLKSGRQPNTGVTLYDTTGVESSNLCADGIMGYMLSRSQVWFRLMFDDDRRTGMYANYLQGVEKQAQKQLQLSAFYDEARLFIRSLLDFGTALMWREENTAEGRPSYKTLHLNRCYIANDQWGDVDVIVRDIWMTPQNAIAEFGEDVVPRQISIDHELNKQEQWLFVSFCFPRNKYNLDFAARRGDYVEVIVPAFAWYEPVRLEAHATKPFFAARYTRTYDAGPWGTGAPGLLQLSNIKQLNALKKDLMRIGQRMADPPIKATLGMKGRLNTVPGAPTFVPDGQDYTREKFEGDPRMLEGREAKLEQTVKNGYHQDFFLVLTNNIEQITKSTATGVQGLMGEKAALLSAFATRLQYEFTDAVIHDLILSEWKAGRIPAAPRGLGGSKYRIDVISPLFQMQRWALEGQNTMNAFQQIGALVQMQLAAGQPGDVLDNFDLSKFARDIAETFNMDKDVVRGLMDVQRIRQGRAAAAQQQAELQQREIESRMNLERARATAATQGNTGTIPFPGTGAGQRAAAQSGGTGLASPTPAPMGAPLSAAR